MALIICPACGKPVSDKAVKCPHCGIKLDAIGNEVSEPPKKEEEKPCITETEQVVNSPCTTEKEQVIKSPKAAISITEECKNVGSSVFDILIVIASLLGAISAIVPLFFDVYGIITRPIPSLINAQPTPLFLMAMGIAIVGGVLCLAAFVYGIVRLINKAQPNLLFWLSSVVIALIASFGTFWTAYYADRAFDKIYNAKVDAARGTYEWVSKRDNSTIIMSVVNNGYVEYHGKEGYISTIYYDYKYDKLGVVINVDGEEIEGWYDADMKYIETESGKISVKKISDLTFTKEEWYAKKREAEQQAALEEYENFRTNDLIFFDVRGHVAQVNMCIDWISPDNNVSLVFSQDGTLQSVNGHKDYIGDLDSDFGIRFMRDDKGRLVKACDCYSYYSAEYRWTGDKILTAMYYSENDDIDVRYSYDNEGKLVSIKTTEDIPETDEEGSGGTINETKKIKYTKFDSKGNWIEREENGRIVSRTIFYY